MYPMEGIEKWDYAEHARFLWQQYTRVVSPTKSAAAASLARDNRSISILPLVVIVVVVVVVVVPCVTPFIS